MSQESLASWGAKPNSANVKRWQNTINEAIKKGISNAKVQAHTTAWRAFQKILTEMQFPIDQLTNQSPDWNTWSEDRYRKHETLLHIFVAEVSEKHERANTSVTYARNLAATWCKQYRTVLWPEQMLADLKPTTKGLEKIKDFAKRERDGFSAADVAILVNTLNKWASSGRKVGRNKKWDKRLAANVAGAIVFCFGLMYRFGDSTCPVGEEFDPRERLTRASVWYAELVAGQPRTMSVDPPVNKCANHHTGRILTGIFSDDCINWPSAIDNILAIDPVEGNKKHITPLFRDTRGSTLLPSGLYSAEGKPLNGDFMRRTLRALVTANKTWFGDRLPATFGCHSMRIGAMCDAVAAGCSLFEVCTMGRWSSDAVFAYHRMTKERTHECQRKAMNTSFSSAVTNMKRAGVTTSLANKRQKILVQAQQASTFANRTARVAVPRSSTRSGRSIAAAAAKQTTLTAWTLPSKTGRSDKED